MALISIIREEYKRHSYLESSKALDEDDKETYRKILKGEGNEIEYRFSIGKLIGYLNKHYGKEVVLLIDEFDTPVIEGEINGYFKEVSEFMQGFLGRALKGNSNVFKGIVTGITRPQGAGIFSGVNSVDVCTIFDSEYKDKFGFNESEVKSLLREYGVENKEKSVREYYNGYNFDGEIIYNPYSVVKFISKGKFGNFWLNSSKNDLARKKVERLLETRGDETLRKNVESLLQGKKVKIYVEDAVKISKGMKAEDILNLLLSSGYLKYENYVEKGGDLGCAEVSIPNLEIKAIYKKTINEWLKDKYTMDDIENLKSFLKSLAVGKEGEIKNRLEKYLSRRSILDGEKVLEMGYHNFLFGLLQGLEGRYLLESNRESGEGRFDIMLTPIKVIEDEGDKKKGVVIELKVGEKEKLKSRSKEALDQIKEKKYYKALREHDIEIVRLIGIAFHKKEAEVSLEEVDLNKK